MLTYASAFSSLKEHCYNDHSRLHLVLGFVFFVFFLTLPSTVTVLLIVDFSY